MPGMLEIAIIICKSISSRGICGKNFESTTPKISEIQLVNVHFQNIDE